jgi:FKBP-type peptidyl-prolyl cis-trans isomerase (trigger factor)
MSEKYTNIKSTKSDNSELEITGEFPVETIAEYRKKALKEIGETMVIPGFRRGHIPEKVLVDRAGEVYILEEAAELAIKDLGPEIIEKNGSQFIGRPNISITKLAPGNPVEFKIKIAVMPEVKLPNYKKIAKEEMSEKEEKVEITDKEIDDVIEEVRKQRAHQEFHKANKDATHHNHDEKEMEKHLPEFNDEFVKTLGAFENVADFRTKAKENLLKEKEFRAKEKRRIKLLEKLIEETQVKLPQVLIDSELNRMFAQFEGDIANMGLKIEDYLKHIKKTPEDLRKDWLADAEKRAKLNIILDTIATDEKIVVDKEMLDHEAKHLLAQYKDADPDAVQAYLTSTLTREKVILMLESQK